MHQEVVLGGSGQAFYVEPIERPQRPASVVVTSHTGVVQSATTECEIDPFESNLAEPAAAGTTELRLKTTECIRPGTRYVIARHGVVVTAVAGDRVTLRRGLPLALPASTPFLGCRISAPVDGAWVASQANVTEQFDVDAGYVLTWTFHTQAGAVTTARSTADLVRTSQLARVTPDDVEGRFPGWRAMVERPDDVIAEAFDIVRRDGRLHRSIRRARHAFALRELAIIAANVIASENAVLFDGAAPMRLAAAEARYQARLAELVKNADEVPVPALAPLAVKNPPALSVAHANVIEAMMEWVGRHKLDNQESLTEFQIQWVPRLRTPDESRAAIMFLRTLQLPKKWGKLRYKLIDMIERRSRAVPEEVPLSVAHANLIDEMMAWVESHPLVSLKAVREFEKVWPSRLNTREHRRAAALYLRAIEVPLHMRNLCNALAYQLEQ